jgi:hypothetical protein
LKEKPAGHIGNDFVPALDQNGNANPQIGLQAAVPRYRVWLMNPTPSKTPVEESMMNGLTPNSEKGRLPESGDRHRSGPPHDWPDGPVRQERHVVITWHWRPSGWLGRLLGAVAVIVLLIWAILFSILFAVLAAVVTALVLAVLVVVAWKVGRARFRWRNGFRG